MPRLILPKRYRYGKRGLTGGSTGGFTTLGPNAGQVAADAGAALVSPWPDFLGDTLPTKAANYATLVPNVYGMGTTWDQGREYSLVSDVGSPSGVALRKNYRGYLSPRMGCAWSPPAAGGASPARGYLRNDIYNVGAGRTWKNLYVQLWYRFSANFSVAARVMAWTIQYSGTATAGSTVTTINDTTKSWSINALAGMYYYHGSQHGAVIISNTPTSFTLAPEDRDDYAATGEAYTIQTATPTGATTVSAGCKGWFFPRQRGHMVGPVVGRGDGSSLGTWDTPKDFLAHTTENHFEGSWWNNGGGVPGGIRDGFALQVTHRWDSPYTEDVNHLPVWGTTRSDAYPVNGAPYLTDATAGDLVKAEFQLKLGVPGARDGIFRCWHNGVLMREHLDVLYTEQYVSALDIENGGGGSRPIIAGVKRDVAYEVVDAYWDYLWDDMTYGGIIAGGVPENEQAADLLAMSVSGV